MLNAKSKNALKFAKYTHYVHIQQVWGKAKCMANNWVQLLFQEPTASLKYRQSPVSHRSLCDVTCNAPIKNQQETHDGF